MRTSVYTQLLYICNLYYKIENKTIFGKKLTNKHIFSTTYSYVLKRSLGWLPIKQKYSSKVNPCIAVMAKIFTQISNKTTQRHI